MNQIEKEINEVLDRHNAKIIIEYEQIRGSLHKMAIGFRIKFEKNEELNKEEQACSTPSPLET